MDNQSHSTELNSEVAALYLKRIGYIEATWDNVLENRIGSHALRTMILIGQGDKRDAVEIYNYLRESEGLGPIDPEIGARIVGSGIDAARHLSHEN